MKEKDALDNESSECPSPDVGTNDEKCENTEAEQQTIAERSTENPQNQQEKMLSLEAGKSNSANGSINELTLELDYEDDILDKVDDICKKTLKDDTDDVKSIDNVEQELKTVFDNKKNEKVKAKDSEEEEGEEDDEKDEGEISDDDDIDDDLPDAEAQDEDDLEEGEVKEPTLPTNQQARQICRFFNNGNCTWGNQCRFLHLSLKDHGCYNMFASSNKAFVPQMPLNMDMALRMPPHLGPIKNREFHRPPPPLPPIPVNKPNPPIQTAWDYSLQCAKEVMEMANERKKQELDYEEKKLHLSAEENFQIGIHNKENYNYSKAPYQAQNNKPVFNKHEESNFREKSQPRNRKSWSEQENIQVPVRRNNWRDRQFAEVEATRSRGDEWRDPWRRSLTPKHRQKRKREYSSESSVSSRSYSTHSSSYSYSDSSRASSVSSRSPSFDRIYHPNKVVEKDKRGKLSPTRETNVAVPIKGKPLYSRKTQKRSNSVLSRDRDSPYHSYSSSRSRSRSRSQSLSNVSSASSYSSWSRSSQTREPAPKKEEVKPQNSQKHTSGRPTRTLFEEMQRLVRYRDLSEAKNSNNNNITGASTTISQPLIPKKKIKKEKVSPPKETVPVKEEKVKLEHAKSIGVRRIKLMKQLQAVEDAIARKRTKFN